MSNLIEIASKYKSTKKMMGFIDIYNYYFNDIKDKNLNIFEIGVETGESLRMFSDYFNKSNIVGLDIENKDYNIERVEIFCGDQSDKKILNGIIEKYKKFDVIIDDGSHKNKDVINSFNHLFPYLKFGGLYVIEDLQTSYISNWGGDGVNLNNKKTTMNFIRSLADRMHYQDIDNPFYQKHDFDGLIEFVHIYRNIAFIKKQKRFYESNLCYKNSWYLGLKKNRKDFNFKSLRDLRYFIKYFIKHILG